MKKLLIFDYDNTLAPPASETPLKIQKEIIRLLKKNFVGIITGGKSFEQLIELFVDKLTLPNRTLLKNLYLCPSYGNKIYKWNNGFRMIYRAKDISEKDRELICKTLKRLHWKDYGIAHMNSNQIQDKGTFVSIECLGKDVPAKKKESWDPEKTKRQSLKEDLDEIFKGKFDVYVTGRNTVDIIPTTHTKEDNVRKIADLLNVPLKDVVFTGDEFTQNGNDFPVLKIDDIQINITRGPEETYKFMQEM